MTTAALRRWGPWLAACLAFAGLRFACAGAPGKARKAACGPERSWAGWDASAVAELDDCAMPGFLREVRLPVLLEFWSKDCVSCPEAGALLDAAAAEHRGRLAAARARFEVAARSARRFGVRMVPTFVLLMPGRDPRLWFGAQESMRADLRALLPPPRGPGVSPSSSPSSAGQGRPRRSAAGPRRP